VLAREQQLERLRTEHFDILVIGGGATGTGIALDAVTRGLKVALVEREDFAAGTSSRSTKLIHGGVRYLEQAVLHLNTQEFHLVTEALHERKTLLHIAPHLVHPLPLVTPLYRWLEAPYYLTGLKLYDWIARDGSIGQSRYISKAETLEHFPLLAAEGLHGGVLYYDGQFNDARMNCSLALTAVDHGAAVTNHVCVTALSKRAGRLFGVEAVDQLTQCPLFIQAHAVINATGPFADHIRHLDDPSLAPMIRGSIGIHLILDQQFCSTQMGLLIPKTEDGRVLFMLPWEGHTLVGTTDTPCEITNHPKPLQEDVDYLLRHLERYVGISLTPSAVLAAWAGIRPLVQDTAAKKTSKICREHHIEVSSSGLISIMGGKWTTYRKMAEETVDEAIATAELNPIRPCQTEQTLLRGAEEYQPEIVWDLVNKYALEPEVATHLAHSYGTKAYDILADTAHRQLLIHHYPYLQAEILYCAREEYACTAIDMLARRTRLAFLSHAASLKALPLIVDLMAGVLNWDTQQRQEELDNAKHFLDTMHIHMHIPKRT
jgi:glycerol-3-phosphate dehydrogenase